VRVEGAGAGSQFLEIYEAHAGEVYRYHSYRTRSKEIAEDLTQLTFERALRAWPRFDPSRASAKTWLLAIARNAWIDHLRRGRHRDAVDIDDLPEGEQPYEDPDELSALSPAMTAALGRLSQREREVLALRFGADMRGPEIAEILDLSLSNAQQILSRSLRKLRRELESAQTASGPDPAAPSAARTSRPKPEQA
jgi:RNA polymerase sigma factor (sigma-70 family)